MDIQDLRIFARVASVQNLSAVGAELGLTPGTVSKRIQALEDELSVRLFERTTRHFRITDEGRTFQAHVERILEELEQARASVGEKVRSPKGRLKISAPVLLGRTILAPAISGFLRTFPEIDLQVDLSDRMIGLQEEGYDVAIRTGVLSDSSLVAKRLSPDHYVVVASPAYIEAVGRPATPEELISHQCLVLGDVMTWPFLVDDRMVSVRVSGRLRASDSELLYRAALGGDGIMRALLVTVADDLAAGRLERILMPYEVKANSGIWAVYPANKYVLPKLRVLLDYLGEWFRTHAPGDGEGAGET